MSEKDALLPTKRISATNPPLNTRKRAEPPDHLRSDISSHALATFQNIGKTRKPEGI